MGKTFDPKQYNGPMSAETYCGQINRLPLLTPEEEFNLAARYRKYNDQESAHKLITSNLRFVARVAYEYKTYGIKLVDLIQEGNIGLMMAVKKFDPRDSDSSRWRWSNPFSKNGESKQKGHHAGGNRK